MPEFKPQVPLESKSYSTVSVVHCTPMTDETRASLTSEFMTYPVKNTPATGGVIRLRIKEPKPDLGVGKHIREAIAVMKDFKRG